MVPRPGHHAPTIEEVARAAGVSRQTVSNALNAPDRLRPDTLRRVLATVQARGYQPNRAARSLRRRESRLVGLRVDRAEPDRSGPLLDSFLHALVAHSMGSGYHILLFTADDPGDEISGFSDLLGTAAVDAFVLTDTHRGDGRLRWLSERGAPFVAFGRPWEEDTPEHPWVDVDGAAGTALCVDHLVERDHRRIGFIGWSTDSDLGNDRRAGWEAACRRHGVEHEGLVAQCVDLASEGAAGAAFLLDRADPPTALVCVSDTLALGALSTLDRWGSRPGRDVAVTGFDDSPAASVVPLGLTSVRQPLEDVAEAIVNRLDAVISGDLPDGPGELLAPSLVVRGST
ncbi:MAG: LacI family DNA-binding transcriptional regulator [Nocardioidaceae bacterium]